MKVGEIVAKIIAKAALISAKAAYATAACFAPYQPKEPENLKDIVK
ncbi:MAG: cyclic lactone autoinducer peptide [Alphaproteobacteria bacterium]|mgnify:CR=1 FL=1|nr:cyclic lactone autoinducer peptide [Alphaproteobacteria bacterium]